MGALWRVLPAFANLHNTYRLSIHIHNRVDRGLIEAQGFEYSVVEGSCWVPCINISDIKNCTDLSVRGELLKLLGSGVFADLRRLIAPAGLAGPIFFSRYFVLGCGS